MISTATRSAKGPASSNPIQSGCVAYIPLGNSACWGTTFKTIDPYGHLCTRLGGVMNGSGFTADGDDYLTLAANSTLQVLTSGAIEMWVKLTTAVGAQTLFAASDIDDAASYFVLYWNPGNGVYATCVEAGTTYYNNRFLSAPFTPLLMVAGTWYHLVLNHNGTTPSLIGNGTSYYIEAGGADNTKFLAAVLGIDNINIGIVRSSGGNTLPLKGTVGECWIYDRVLTVAEAAYSRSQTAWRYS